MRCLPCDYRLSFPKSARKDVIEALRAFCSPDTEAALAVLHDPIPVQTVVAFRSKPDMTDAIKACPPLERGVRRLDGIHIQLSYSKSVHGPRGLVFRIRPGNDDLHDGFFASRLLRLDFVRLMEQYQGYVAMIVVGDADPCDFWRRQGPGYFEDAIRWCTLPPQEVVTKSWPYDE